MSGGRGSAGRVDRRTVLRAAAVGGAAIATAACAAPGDRQAGDTNRTSPSNDLTESSSGGSSSTLLIYFSRAGENYYFGDRRDLEVGNTAVLARLIAEQSGCDLYEVEPAEPYSDDYDETVARNVREQDTEARPAIAGALPALDGYDVVLLASPIWNVRPPRIMHTVTDALDFSGKTVHPVTTHAMSGLGRSETEYAEACAGAVIGEGLAVQGEEAAAAGPVVAAWLRRTDITQGESS